MLRRVNSNCWYGNDDDIIEIVLSKDNEEDTNDCNGSSQWDSEKVSFEAALTALKTMIEFIKQQPDNSFVAREDVVNLQSKI